MRYSNDDLPAPGDDGRFSWAGLSEVLSAGAAGPEPADQLNPSIAAVLEERGLDPAGEHPKLLTTDDGLDADVIVTRGMRGHLPVYPGKRYLDWDLPDPAGQPVDAIRPIVDDIDQRVQNLLAEFTSPAAP